MKTEAYSPIRIESEHHLAGDDHRSEPSHIQRQHVCSFPNGNTDNQVRQSVPKKIPRELRRLRIDFSIEPNILRRTIWRLKEDSQFLRQTIQLAFALLCVWIGVEFYLFVRWGQSIGATPFASRPPGAEGFLPISALISLKYWLLTGIVNDIHPSGLFIFLGIVAVSVAMKKSFCSWLCPIGTLSEALWMLGQKLFGHNVTLPRWLDVPLRSLKYLLLAFFVWVIVGMDVSALKEFIASPYNKVADVKMYLFFAAAFDVCVIDNSRADSAFRSCEELLVSFPLSVRRTTGDCWLVQSFEDYAKQGIVY